jgi:hypothetical protein
MAVKQDASTMHSLEAESQRADFCRDSANFAAPYHAPDGLDGWHCKGRERNTKGSGAMSIDLLALCPDMPDDIRALCAVWR